MARPRYETEEHLQAEEVVAEVLEEMWTPLKAHKLPIKYVADYAFVDPSHTKSIRTFVEVRCRNHMSTTYGTYMISLYKFMKMLELKEVTNVNTILVVDFKDGLYQCPIKPERLYPPHWGGMGELRDWQDKEPVIYIPMSEFVLLKEKYYA
jgi:hypothetical protein|tara:strand:- start:20 stop:472 length:453 start_codon:yes stop_codon:yes gene_type:complete